MKLREGNVFTPVCQSFCSLGRGACVAGGMHGRGHAWQGACMAGETGNEAGNKHPTGMHSCLTIEIFVSFTQLDRRFAQLYSVT